MKKSVKISLIVVCVLIGMILFDTIQALIFNHSPLIRIREDYNGGTLYYKDCGIIVDSYQYTNGEKETVFKWKK